MKKIIVFFILTLVFISCQSNNDPGNNLGGDDTKKKEWSILGASSIRKHGVYPAISLVGETPYIAYSDDDNLKVSVMKYEGSSWSYFGSKYFSRGETDYISIASAPNGTVYVAYRDNTYPKSLVVQNNNGNGWQTTPTGLSGGLSDRDIDYTSMAINNNNLPYVAVIDSVLLNNSVSLLKFDGSSWNANVVIDDNIGSPASEKVTSIAVNNDVAYIAYIKNGADKAKVKKNDGLSTTDMGTDITEAAVKNLNIAVAESGDIYLAYEEDIIGADNAISVLKYSGSSWIAVGQKNFAKTETGTYRSKRFLAVHNNIPYVVFNDLEAGDKLTAMKFNGTSWEAVGKRGLSIGKVQEANIAISKNGNIYIFYSDEDEGLSVIAYK